MTYVLSTYTSPFCSYTLSGCWQLYALPNTSQTHTILNNTSPRTMESRMTSPRTFNLLPHLRPCPRSGPVNFMMGHQRVEMGWAFIGSSLLQALRAEHESILEIFLELRLRTAMIHILLSNDRQCFTVESNKSSAIFSLYLLLYYVGEIWAACIGGTCQ
jgi:hypothetical protein